MTQIVIVAGGLATRLQPIAEEIPKCLIDVNGTPLIEHQLEFFKSKGYTDIIFCVAHLAEKVKDYFGDGKKFGMNIQYVQETEELLGTAGSVKLVEQLIPDGEDFVVYYGDNLTNIDFDKLLQFHKDKGAAATIVVRPLPEGYKSSSVITLESDSKVKVFLEKPPMEVIEKYKNEKCYINSGIYVFKKTVLQGIPPNEKYDFAKQVFPGLMQKNSPVYGYVTEEFFREIGRTEKYEKFLEEIKGKKKFL